MSKLARLFLPILVVFISGRASAVEPRRPGQESFLKRAVFAEGRLWLLSDAGDLSSIEEGKDIRVEETLPEPAFDLCRQNGQPVVVTCTREDCRNWTLRRRATGKWSVAATVLRRIDRRSGRVTMIEQTAAGESLRGPLNAALDPVNGIAVEPWRPDCIAAAVGLVHFTPHGRIVEVCGDKVRRLYYKQYGEEPSGDPKVRDREPDLTVAFFGLTRQGDVLWAIGLDGIHRIEAGGAVTFAPLPKFKKIGGVQVSFDLPHLILVLTSINQRRSISGSVPILVPR